MDTDHKSRTRRKNDYKALQRLGEQLVGLLFGQLKVMVNMQKAIRVKHYSS